MTHVKNSLARQNFFIGLTWHSSGKLHCKIIRATNHLRPLILVSLSGPTQHVSSWAQMRQCHLAYISRWAGAREPIGGEVDLILPKRITAESTLYCRHPISTSPKFTLIDHVFNPPTIYFRSRLSWPSFYIWRCKV